MCRFLQPCGAQLIDLMREPGPVSMYNTRQSPPGSGITLETAQLMELHVNAVA